VTVALGVSVVAVLFVLSSLHVRWSLGGRGVPARVLPQRPGKDPVRRPTPGMTLLVAVALGAAGFAVAGFLVVGGPLLRVAVLGLALVFAARAVGDFTYVGLFKRVRGTEFARYDAALYTPLCLLLGLALLLVGLS
jgi:hypothetical protein